MLTLTLNQVLERCSQTVEFSFEPVTSVHQHGMTGETPLHVVCGWGDAEAVRVLLNGGANVNAIGDLGRTPLFRAVAGENVEVVTLILAAGANVSIRDQLGQTALEIAVLLGSSDIAGLLVVKPTN